MIKLFLQFDLVTNKREPQLIFSWGFSDLFQTRYTKNEVFRYGFCSINETKSTETADLETFAEEFRNRKLEL